MRSSRNLFIWSANEVTYMWTNSVNPGATTRPKCGYTAGLPAHPHTVLRQAFVSFAVLGAGCQRCRVHFQRNLLGRVGKAHKPVVSAVVKTVFAEKDRDQAHVRWREVADSLRERFRDVAELMGEAEHDVLAYMAFDESLRAPAAEDARLLWLSSKLKLSRLDLLAVALAAAVEDDAIVGRVLDQLGVARFPDHERGGRSGTVSRRMQSVNVPYCELKY